MNTGVFVGIDFGTSNSCIAVYKYGRAEVLAGADGSRITPSCVFIEPDGEIFIGKSAINYGQRQPESNCFPDIKRLFAVNTDNEIIKKFKHQWSFNIKRRFHEYNYEIDKKLYSPEEIAAEILKKLVSYVEEQVDGVVIAVPAFFSSEQKSKLLKAAKMADLRVLQLVCEPTAAAIAYGMEHSYINGEYLLVFDMGAGTLDITVIKVTNKTEFEVVELGGDSHLGGRDFDGVIVDWTLTKLKEKGGNFYSSSRKKHQISEMAKEAKEALSQAEDAVIKLSELACEANDVAFTRQKFEEISEILLEKVTNALKNAIKDLEKEEINHVLFVGGASKMPMISKLLKEFFNEAKFSKTVNAEEIVALGATQLAAKLGEQSTRAHIANLKIKDTTSLEIGVEVFENGESKFKKIFDSVTPYGQEEIFTLVTTEDNQIRCEIPLYEGSVDERGKKSFIGSIVINNLPPAKAGELKIDVQLAVDKNGILKACEGNNYNVRYRQAYE